MKFFCYGSQENKNDEFAKIQFFQFNYIDSEVELAILASFLCATIIFVVLRINTPDWRLYLWYGFFIAVSALQILIIRHYKQQVFSEEHLPLRKKLFFLCVILGSLSWGLVGGMLFPMATIHQQTLIILIIAGVTAGVVPALGAILSATLIYLIVTLVPLIVQIMHEKNDIYMFFDIAITVYLLYLIMLSFRTNKTIKRIMALQISNEKLLHNLSHTNEELSTANQQLSLLATQDPLTQVDNGRVFYTHFANAIQRAHQKDNLVALLYLDVDNFKSINDTFGHHIGDQVLVKIVAILKSVLRKTDFISRLGGDEFTVTIESIATKEQIKKIAQKICAEIAKPVEIENKTIRFSLSIGIGIYPEDGQDVIALKKAADEAMYVSKNTQRGSFHFFTIDKPVD